MTSRDGSSALAAGTRWLSDALTNRGTAFTDEERRRLGLEGLLPPRVESLPEQLMRVLEAVRAKARALDKYLLLSALQRENATLFYRVVLDHLEELLPIVYTPTVGEACLNWSRIYERPQGLYIAARHRGRVAEILKNWPHRPRIIVVTDGGRILGLGDLGANGMGIPIGKLALYTVCGGVPPELCLPVTIDVGTDNEPLRGDPFYLGTREPRLSGAAYDAQLEEFVCAAQQVFPDVIVQFEDFNNHCAFGLLERYRTRLCCFNDDIQGTGAMGLAGLQAAARIVGKPLADQRILFVGAGEACLGIGGLVVRAMRRDGVPDSEARRRCLFVDSHGLLVASRADLAPHKRAFAQDLAPQSDLPAIIERFQPTVLIGACAVSGAFSQPVLAALARVSVRPIVFALSNPTSKSECTAEQAYAWTQGRAIFASGSPFDPVELGGRVNAPGQANNACVFPGVGLGLLASGATRVTDEMLLAAADAVSRQVSDADLERGRIFPAASRLRDVAAAVAIAVAETAYEQGCASKPRPRDVRAEILSFMYEPRYPAADRAASP